jgi:hypothetical protein
VLVEGGTTTNGQLASAELFDPESGEWTTTGSMSAAREFHTATRLGSGLVLAAGGSSGGGRLGSTELYDPRTGMWTAGGTLIEGRFRHTATLLADGRVLVAGGSSRGGATPSAELYDPNTRQWSFTGSMATGRAIFAATLVSNLQVLVVGGSALVSGGDLIILDAAELFNPNDGTWTATGGLRDRRFLHTITLLVDGRVLVTGGNGSGFGALSSAELYQP